MELINALTFTTDDGRKNVYIESVRLSDGKTRSS